MKFEDVLYRKSKDQFIYREVLTHPRKMAFTECSIDNTKHMCFDFGDDQHRYVMVDMLLLVLKEFYGEEYLQTALKEIKSYDYLISKKESIGL